ncbi:MAG: DUF5312 domain-containing protein [Spirochaetaceae bacterium]|jgi:hypothetical protein|nr:DUF5312 domain-containing protein [Spirochaetaceae bacterium]
MTENGTFSRLVSEMSLEERNHLLERLTVQSNISNDPLYEDKGDNLPAMDVAEQFANLPWYQHLRFFIMSLFKTISQVKLFEESQIHKLGKHILTTAPGVFDYKRNLLLPLFYDTLVEMRDGARFFYSALDTSINRDKGAFYAFLGSLEMNEIHERLQTQTNPHVIAKRFPDFKEADLRKTAFHEMNEAINEITQEQRAVMYEHARSLECLKNLASFRYERVLLSFTFDPLLQGHTSPAHVMLESLENLNNILVSFRDPPSMPLIESLFVFILHEKMEDDDESGMDMEMRDLLGKAENALIAIRTFNKEIPLTVILRCAGRNLGLNTRPITGGEDWFVVYHDYWRERIEQQLSEFRSMRRQQGLMDSLKSFFNGKDMKHMEHVYSEENPDGLPINGTFSLSFLLTFYSIVFINNINNGLRNILIDGKFARRENRTVFTENYNNLIKLEDDIKQLDTQLSGAGDYGKRYALALSENSLQSRRRKIQVVLDDATDEAEELISRTKTSIEGLITMLTAIITKDSNGEYTTLINMSRFMAKDETTDIATTVTVKGMTFLTTMRDVIQKFQQTLSILEDITVLDLDSQ